MTIWGCSGRPGSLVGDRHPGRTHHPLRRRAAPLERRGAEEVRDAAAKASVVRTLTWDQGTEMTGRCEITIAKDLDLYLLL